ncbi:ABC transporter permease [Diplocloster hominis]|uniref:ABC transporter permease n=1 Tax=Diplocloster hominis TaxID=3079010 RepID=UPI0031BA62C1
MMDEKVKKWQAAVYGSISITLFLIAWQVVITVSPAGNLVPGPLKVILDFFAAFAKPIGEYTLAVHIMASLARVLFSNVIAAILGIAIGLLMGWYRAFEAVFKPVFEVLRPIPAIAWIPISILLFGLGEQSKIFILFLAAFVIVTVNAYDGSRNVDPTLVGAARMLGAKETHIFKSIVLPASVPQIFAGLQNALSVSWMTVLAAEMVRSSEGIGWIVVAGMDNGNTDQILVGMVAIGITGFLLSVMMRGVEKKLCVWNERGR